MTQTLPARFQELWRHCAVLCDEHYFEAEGLDDGERESEMRAAAYVLHGAMLQKFRKSGRERPHRRFLRVECSTSSLSGRRQKPMLHWDKKSGEIVRADWRDVRRGRPQGKLQYKKTKTACKYMKN